MCRLSRRQAQLYEEYMSRSSTRAALGGGGQFMGMMNVLMQLRKVCNHPDLFEPRPIASPFVLEPLRYATAALVTRDSVHSRTLSSAAPPEAAVTPGGWASWRHVSPELTSFMWAWPAAGSGYSSLWGLDGLAAESVAALAAPAGAVVVVDDAALPVQDPDKVRVVEGMAARVAALLKQLRTLLREDALAAKRTMAAVSASRCCSPLLVLSQQTVPAMPLQQQQQRPAIVELTAAGAATVPTVATDATSEDIKPAVTTASSDDTADSAVTITDTVDISATAGRRASARSSSSASTNTTTVRGHPLNWRLIAAVTLSPLENPLLAAALAQQCDPPASLVKAGISSRSSSSSSSTQQASSKALAAAAARARRAVPAALISMVRTRRSQYDAYRPYLERFTFAVPPAVGWAPQLVSADDSTTVSSARASSALTAALASAGGTEVLHTTAARLRIGFPERTLVQYDSGKLQALAPLLRRLKSGGHKCLIFTQMTRMLDVLERFLALHGHTYVRLDGSTGVERRQRLMDRFNSDNKLFVFILSTRSGGLGINLTGADTVIFFDSDWNPAMDAQAQDRAHRIGQTRDVHIYRCVHRCSVYIHVSVLLTVVCVVIVESIVFSMYIACSSSCVSSCVYTYIQQC
jgi:Helicase conserved C-terminal domain